MLKNGAAMKRISLMIAMLILAALACNFQSNEVEGESPSPTASKTSTPESPGEEVEDVATVGAPETLPAIVATEAEEPTEELAPTFTPILAPTLAVTNTPSPTATRRVNPTSPSNSGQTPGNSSGPLKMEYFVEWRLKDPSAKQAIATVTLTASGGSGGYHYFRDIEEMAGPTFEYEWATCQPNPVTFRVTSASGESVEEVLFLHPPCPTPTPTP